MSKSVDVSKYIIEVSKEELKRIAITGTRLHKWQGNDKNGIHNVIKKMGSIQLDPLNPAGREHDIFLLSRLKNYKIGEFEKIAYSERLIFESYGFYGHSWGILCAFDIVHFPYFYARAQTKYLGNFFQPRLEKFKKEHPKLLEKIEEFVSENGGTIGADLKELGNADPSYASWKSGRLGGTALENLWLLGRLVVSKRDINFRKTYDIPANYIPKKLLYKEKLSEDELAIQAFIIKQKSRPLINLGSLSRKKESPGNVGLTLKKSKKFNPVVFTSRGDSNPVILHCEDKNIGLAAPSNWKKLAETRIDNAMRAIAPLDPLIWDRRVTKDIFDFDYTWEVYKRPHERKWGYYVYPLLYDGKLIARLEAKFDRKTNILKFFNFQPENNFPLVNKTETALIKLLNRWGKSLSAKEILTDESFKKYGPDVRIVP